MAWRAVTDKQWEAIRPRLPKPRRSRTGGRPPLDDRKCFEGILWILWTGAPWSELPGRYGSKSAAHRRLKEWAEREVLLNLWRAFLDQLSDRQKVRWDECNTSGMFIRAKKGACWSGRLAAAREQSSWYWPMGEGTPLGVRLEKASPAEVKLLEPTLKQVRVRVGGRRRGRPRQGKPERLIGDRGYDSNGARALLVKRGIEPIIPARSNRPAPSSP